MDRDMVLAAGDRRTCFVSYSWDSEAHKQWVRELVDHLTHYGVITVLDQYDLHPGKDVLKFMEQSITESDYVLLICTPRFKEKSRLRAGGVGWEGTIVTGEMFHGQASEGKFVPILRAGSPSTALPAYLATKYYIDFTDSADASAALEELVRHIYESPKHKKPALGVKPNFEIGGKIQWLDDLAQAKPTPRAKPRIRSKEGPASVFLNCSFDRPHARLFEALVFTVMRLGFMPRSVSESRRRDHFRLQRLFAVMAGCKYGIHDLSGIKVSSARGLRLNIPFELGVFQGLRRFGSRGAMRHSLILTTNPGDLGRDLSDLAGMDIHSHGGDPAKLITIVSNWLAEASGRYDVPALKGIRQEYRQFRSILPQFKKHLGLAPDQPIPFSELASVVSIWLSKDTRTEWSR